MFLDFYKFENYSASSICALGSFPYIFCKCNLTNYVWQYCKTFINIYFDKSCQLYFFVVCYISVVCLKQTKSIIQRGFFECNPQFKQKNWESKYIECLFKTWNDIFVERSSTVPCRPQYQIFAFYYYKIRKFLSKVHCYTKLETYSQPLAANSAVSHP